MYKKTLKQAVSNQNQPTPDNTSNHRRQKSDSSSPWNTPPLAITHRVDIQGNNVKVHLYIACLCSNEQFSRNNRKRS